MRLIQDELNKKAIDRYREFKYEEAGLLFKRCAEKYPSIESYNNLAWYYFYEEGDLEYALAVIEAINFSMVEDFYPHAIYGDILIEDGQFEESIVQYKSGIYLEENPIMIHNLALAYYLLQDYKQASKFFLRSYKLGNEEALDCYYISLQHLDLDILKEILLSGDPGPGDDILLYAELMYEIEEYKLAVKYFKQAYEEYYIDSIWLAKYLDSYMKMNSPNKALEIIEDSKLDCKEINIYRNRVEKNIYMEKIRFNNYLDIDSKLDGVYLFGDNI